MGTGYFNCLSIQQGRGNLIPARTEENVTEAVQADPLNKSLVQIQGVFAELEKNQLVHRLKKGRQTAKEKTGRCEGRKPYGETAEEQAVCNSLQVKPEAFLATATAMAE